eukprot:2771278-Lingulodinium_polyedra.AAC.1
MPEEGVAVMTVSKCCPYYDGDATTYDYNDKRLQDICGIKVKLGPQGALACPMITFAEDRHVHFDESFTALP